MIHLSRRQAALGAVLYLLAMTYASTIVGPMGLHFVWRAPSQALDALLRLGFVPNGSDQRADWMGNLMMLVPFGFLAAQAMPMRRPPASVLALVLCILTIYGIKYLQLFFPPRTVTLNYIAAQSLGASIGIAGWWRWNARQIRYGRAGSVEILILVLRLYLLALVVFLLEPLDFALSPADLWMQAQRVPATLAALPGPDRPMAVRAFVLAAATLAFACC